MRRFRSLSLSIKVSSTSDDEESPENTPCSVYTLYSSKYISPDKLSNFNSLLSPDEKKWKQGRWGVVYRNIKISDIITKHSHEHKYLKREWERVHFLEKCDISNSPIHISFLKEVSTKGEAIYISKVYNNVPESYKKYFVRIQPRYEFHEHFSFNSIYDMPFQKGIHLDDALRGSKSVYEKMQIWLFLVMFLFSLNNQKEANSILIRDLHGNNMFFDYETPQQHTIRIMGHTYYFKTPFSFYIIDYGYSVILPPDAIHYRTADISSFEGSFPYTIFKAPHLTKVFKPLSPTELLTDKYLKQSKETAIYIHKRIEKYFQWIRLFRGF